MTTKPRTADAVVLLFARLALGASFLSAVADRFGLYGPPGALHVAWGDFAHFTAYTATITRFSPTALIPTLAWVATGLEIGLGFLLVVGLFTRHAALVAGCLLLVFGVSMATSVGLKTPLDFSVFTAASAGFLLARLGPGRWSLDRWRAPTASAP